MLHLVDADHCTIMIEIIQRVLVVLDLLLLKILPFYVSFFFTNYLY